MNNKSKWDSLTLKEKSEVMKVAISSGVMNLNNIRNSYNSFADGGPTENPKQWEALRNANYEAIADTTFTRELTGAGSIEYFPHNSEGITYPNGYYRKHPKPGNNVILYNPKENDQQDIRLDALHMMPDADPTYAALNALYREAARNSDVMYNAEQRYNEDVEAYGKNNVDSQEDYFRNEADGLLRNMFIEGTPEYIESKRYYPDKEKLKEWNSHLMPFINDIQTYLETGINPNPNIIDPVYVIGKQKRKKK
jgi:hypothetical protein